MSIKFSHGQYQSFVQSFLTQYFIKTGQGITIVLRANLILKLWIADLTGVVGLIRDRYRNSPYGTPPKDPVALLISLILMTLYGETSIAKWVNTLRSEPFYAILSGFIPACHDLSAQDTLNAETLPGVGTFYDFMDRLISKDRALNMSRFLKPRRKPKKQLKKNEKYDSSKPGVVERLVKRVLKYPDSDLPISAESSLNTILKDLFVLPSLSMGILGDKDNFNTAGDGTCMPTCASHYGKKICNCDLKPGQSCDCIRKFIDPTASWGWDSYNEAWFYGHSFHCFTACDSFYSLAIHIKCVTAERHDSVTGVYALAELLRLYPQIWFKAAAFDSAYDANYFYHLNLSYGINPVIDLNERASKPVSRNGLIEYDEYGIPHGKVCGFRFRNWGLMQDSFRRKWLFPAQCDNCDRCPAQSNWCKYTPTKDNPRYFSPIVRGTNVWRSYYKRRSTTERLWDRVKLDFNAKTAVVYSKEQRIVRVFLGAFCCYIDAWFNESSLRITDIFPELQVVAA